MPKIEGISLVDLHEQLEDVNEKKPTQRVLLAVLYKQEPSVPMIAEWFDMRERTIYDWYDRMEQQPLEEAIHDRPRSGRPSKLTDELRTAFESALDDDPREHGYEADCWTPAVAQSFIRHQFGIRYTGRHVQRLLNDAEVAW